jgi:hypothetical protein
MEQGQEVSSADAIVMGVPDRLIGKNLKGSVAMMLAAGER